MSSLLLQRIFQALRASHSEQSASNLLLEPVVSELEAIHKEHFASSKSKHADLPLDIPGICASLLAELSLLIDAEGTPDTITIQESNTLRCMIEIVFCVGVEPCLPCGVGIPMALRSRHFTFTENTSTSDSNQVHDAPSELDKYNRCLSYARALIACKCSPTIWNTITTCLADFFSLLFFLQHDQQSKITDDVNFESEINELLDEAPVVEVFIALMFLLQQRQSPAWLRGRVGAALSRRLVGRGGLRGLMAAMAACHGDPDAETAKDRAVLQTVALVLRKPRTFASYAEYISTLTPQIIGLLRCDDAFGTAAAGVLLQQLSSIDLNCTKDIMQKLASPLFLNNVISNGCEENAVAQCIEDLHRVLLAGPIKDLWVLADDAFDALLTLHFHSRHSTCFLKSQISQLAGGWLRLSPLAEDRLFEWICRAAKGEANRIRAAVGASGGAVLMKNEHPEDSNNSKGLLDIRIDDSDDDVVPRYCESDLRNVIEMIVEAGTAGCIIGGRLFSRITQHMESSQSKPHQIGLMHALQLILENSSDSLAHAGNAVPCLSRLLRRFIQSHDADNIMMIAAAVGAIVSAGAVPDSGWSTALLEPLQESLQHLVQQKENEEMSQAGVMVLVALNARNKHKNNSGDGSTLSMDAVNRDLGSDIAAVRANGMMTLRCLIENRHDDVMSDWPQVAKMVRTHLLDEESCVYLSAIDALVAMSDAFSDRIIKEICSDYQNPGVGLQVRLKLGEVIVRNAIMLGEMLPKYMKDIMGALLSGCKDQDDLLRSSSLSCLGTVCGKLGYALHPYCVDVVSCCSALLRFDASSSVRCNAAMCLRLLHEGIGPAAPTVLKGHSNTIRETLLIVSRNDPDDHVRAHCAAALIQIQAAYNAISSS